MALGIVALMRGGLVSFGQGTFYCAGAYAAGMAMHSLGVGDAAVLVALGAVAGLILGVIIAPLLAGYRGIFFATLTLALSMIVYGISTRPIRSAAPWAKSACAHFFRLSSGSIAGCQLRAVSLYQPLTVVAAALCRIHFDSVRGLLSLAARDNEFAWNISAPRYAGSAA